MPKILGKNSHFIANGVELPFREIEFEIQRMIQENTGSRDYDPISGVLYGRNRVVKLWFTAKVSGFYDALAIPASLLGWLFGGDTAVPCSIFQPGSVIAGRGNMDISDFRSRTPFDNIVEYTLTARSNGFWTPL